MFKKLFIGTCLLFSMASSFALQKIYIFHINGVNTNQVDADRNRAALNSTINAQSNVIANNGQVDLLYNKEDNDSYCSLCKQLGDVLQQKKYENITLDDYVAAYITDKKLDIKPGTPEYADLKNNIKAKYFADPAFMGNNFTDILNQFHQKLPSSLNTAYLNEYLAKGVAAGSPKPFILLIPHSQGNLYANNLYKELTASEGYDQSNLSIYGIASPASSNLGDYISKTSYGNSGYITSSSDAIINSLRVLAAVPPATNVLPANYSMPIPMDISGHGLITNYLSDSGAKQQIATNIYNIVHYFWLSDIYSNFPQTIGGGNRILSPGVNFVATQATNSTLSIEGVMANGNCPSAPYFVVRDGTYDNEIGIGKQCLGTHGGNYNLRANDFYDSNTIKLKVVNGGNIRTNTFQCAWLDAPSSGKVQDIAGSRILSSPFYSGIIGGSSDDRNCLKPGVNEPYPGEKDPQPGVSKKDRFFGIVGSLYV